MPAYIETGLMKKYLPNSPKRIETEEMVQLAEEACDIDDMVEKLRGKKRKPLDEKTRELHRKASALWRKYYDIDAIINKEYHEYWSTST